MLYQKVTKIWGLENLSLWQRINSFNDRKMHSFHSLNLSCNLTLLSRHFYPPFSLQFIQYWDIFLNFLNRYTFYNINSYVVNKKNCFPARQINVDLSLKCHEFDSQRYPLALQRLTMSTHLCPFGKSKSAPIWSIKSDRVNLVAPASPIECLLY